MYTKKKEVNIKFMGVHFQYQFHCKNHNCQRHVCTVSQYELERGYCKLCVDQINESYEKERRAKKVLNFKGRKFIKKKNKEKKR